MEKSEFNFRKLELEDAYLVLDIIEALGIDEFKDCFKNEKFDKTIKEATKNKAKIDIDKLTLSFGYDAVFNCISKIIKNIKKCKKQVYAFISAISETNIEEVAKLNLWKVAKNLLELSKDEDFKDFLEVASSLKK